VEDSRRGIGLDAPGGEKVALVQGASRGIGFAITQALLSRGEYRRVFATCRRPDEATRLGELRSRSERLAVLRLDVLDEESITASAEHIRLSGGRLDLLVNCAGVLHEDGGLWPEKRLADVDAHGVEAAFRVNALGALLVARGFEGILRSSPSACFAALSARVGGIADNRRGGWYAYRASKAALNMMIRTLAIEWGRLPRPISCFALHPGTVATDLSAPFRRNLAGNQVFDPGEAAGRLLSTIDSLTQEQSGGFFAYDGTRIEW